MKTISVFAIVVTAALSFEAGAAPTISGVEGQVAHMGQIVVRGSGFGAKGTARPVVWENCTSGNLSSDWSGAWPNRSSNAGNNTACRTPHRNVSLPHGNVSRYVAGSHGTDEGHNAGWNVILYKSRSVTSFPSYTYASWYQRSDDAWTFCGDNNYKTFDYSTGTGPYDPDNWYIEYNSPPRSRTSTPEYHLNNNGTPALDEPDANGHDWWWNTAINPMAGQWIKVELEIRYARDATGYVKLWENGSLRVDYRGPTDRYSGSQRNEGIGGYARCYYPNNWRYFSDIYLDYTRARVVLTDNANYASATIFEPQIPTSWADGQIQFNMNLGRISAAGPKYLFVFAPDGTRNAQGIPLSGGSVTVPMPPASLQVQ